MSALFDDWWSKDGQYIDPDFSDVPWFDKRRGLAEAAFDAGLAQALQSARLQGRREGMEEASKIVLARKTLISGTSDKLPTTVAINQHLDRAAAAIRSAQPTTQEERDK